MAPWPHHGELRRRDDYHGLSRMPWPLFLRCESTLSDWKLAGPGSDESFWSCWLGFSNPFTYPW